jgi:hypothetical protein
MTQPDDAGRERTAKATAALMRKAEERRAAWLRDRGWTCTPPSDQTEKTDQASEPTVRMEDN